MKTLSKNLLSKTYLILIGLLLVVALVLVFYKILQKQRQITAENIQLSGELVETRDIIASISAEIERLNKEDLRLANAQVRKEIEELKTGYKVAVVAYEEVLALGERGSNITSEQSKFSSILNFLAKNDLVGAQKVLKELTEEIAKEKMRLASLAVAPIPANVPAINTAPASGYRRQKVEVDGASFLVEVVAADLNSTRVVVDTASDGTCTNNCPVLPLATYVSRSGAFAGINGTYFCPETYPSCVDKKNSFDTLLMNKNKVYFNSDNNVYSTVPVAIFSGSSARFIGQSSGWGRDTGVDAVIANRPLLVLDGNIMFGSGGEEKEAARGNRSFLGATGNIGYIGVVRGASVAESAKVLHAMGIKSAINLDSGGSTAFWSGGYKVGPGRNIPNAVLFVRK